MKYRTGMTIDAWMQHPTPRLAGHEMLESLRRWTGMAAPTEDVPIELTLAAMDAAGVDFGLICAWSSRACSVAMSGNITRLTATITLYGTRATRFALE